METNEPLPLVLSLAFLGQLWCVGASIGVGDAGSGVIEDVHGTHEGFWPSPGERAVDSASALQALASFSMSTFGGWVC